MRTPGSTLFALSPSGHLYFGTGESPTAAADHPIRALLELGARDADEATLPPVEAYWRHFARLFLTSLCAVPELEEQREGVSVPPSAELEALAAAVPPMVGAEYLTHDVLLGLWRRL